MTILTPGRLPLRNVAALESYVNDDGTFACDIMLRSEPVVHAHDLQHATVTMTPVCISGFTGRITIIKE